MRTGPLSARSRPAKCPQKVRQYLKETSFRPPKGLAVCESQTAGPSALPESGDCCNGSDSRASVCSAPRIQHLADTAALFCADQRNSQPQCCRDSFPSGSCSAGCPFHGDAAGIRRLCFAAAKYVWILLRFFKDCGRVYFVRLYAYIFPCIHKRSSMAIQQDPL